VLTQQLDSTRPDHVKHPAILSFSTEPPHCRA
jgi:hypothetical protein